MTKSMTIKKAKRIVGMTKRMGNTTKMPGHSYGLPATKCKAGAKMRKIPGTVCHKCYAFRGCYTYGPVRKGLMNRFNSLNDPQWTEAMTLLIKHYVDPEVPYYRWHDSGDIQSIPHLLHIVEIARWLPDILFWLPTKESELVSKFTKVHKVPDNLIIRVSAVNIDGPPPKWAKNTSTVTMRDSILGFECPSKKQGNKCLDCRACWDQDVDNITYLFH